MAQVSSTSVSISASTTRFANPQSALASGNPQSFESSLQFALAAKVAPARGSAAPAASNRAQTADARSTRRDEGMSGSDDAKSRPDTNDLYGGDPPQNGHRVNANRPHAAAPRAARPSIFAANDRPSAFQTLADKSIATEHIDGGQAFQTGSVTEGSFQMITATLTFSSIESATVSADSGNTAKDPATVDYKTANDANDPAKVEVAANALGAFLAAFLAMQAQLDQATTAGNNAAPTTGHMDTSSLGAIGSLTSVKLSVQILSVQLVTGQGDPGQIATKLASLGGFGSDETVMSALNQISGMALNEHPDVQSMSDLFATISSLVQPGSQSGSSPDDMSALLAGLLSQLSDGQDQTFDLANLHSRSVAPSTESASTSAASPLAQLATRIAHELSASNGQIGSAAAGSNAITESITAATSLMSIADMGQKMNLNAMQGSTTLAIQLNPESLGTVNVAIEKTASGIIARIDAQTAEGEAAVKSTIDQVRGALQAAGIKVDDIQVSGPGDREQVTSTQSVPQTVARQEGGATAGNGSQFQANDQSSNNPPAAPTPTSTTSVRSETTTGRGPIAFDAGLGNAQESGGIAGSEAPAWIDPQVASRVSTVNQSPTRIPAIVAVSSAGDADAEVANAPANDDSIGSVSGPSGGTMNPSRLEGTTQADAPASNREAATQLVKDIAAQIGTLAAQGKSEFQLQLRPDALGRLHLRMSLDDGAVTVRMTAETAEARVAIESNLPQLRHSFQEQGLRVDRFVIDVSQAGQFTQDGGHPRRSRGWVDPELNNNVSTSGDDFARVLAGIGGGNRPVDYRA